MTRNLVRFYGQGDLHFLTFSCYRRLPFLGTSGARNEFVSALAEIRKRHSFSLIGYVVMPEHVHLLITESPASSPSVVVKVLKHRARRRIHAQETILSLHVQSARTDLRTAFWTPRFHDRNIRGSHFWREKLDYMHRNPVKRGLVQNPADWPWSSYSNYEAIPSALIPIDFI